MYCKLYLNFSKKEVELEKIITTEINGRKCGFSISSTELDISIFNNNSYSKIDSTTFPDGFLYYQYILEIESNTEDRNTFVDSIGKLLHVLWERKIPAVASCDFEEELPMKGGFKSEEIFNLGLK